MKHRRTARAQSGVIPYRISRGRVEIALVTASKGRRWTIPKGHINAGLTEAESAVQEAYEEAGLLGQVEHCLLGRYWHDKRGVPRRVRVYAMAVERQLKSWPEVMLRERRWFSVEDAAASTKIGGLKRCLARLEARLSRRQARSKRAAA
jgi:8-oxo-dGTP pyrophosphatase MutT (NUDIX family)